MKKGIFTIIAIILCAGYGLLSWNIVSYSQAPDPEDSEYATICSVIQASNDRAPDEFYDECCITYNEALGAVKKDWEQNLKKIASQEKPTSEKVEDAYESLRTYQCWMEYICLAVQYSGIGPIQSTLGTGLTEEHLGTIPGCQSPDNLRMESEYNYFNTGMKDLFIVGIAAEVTEDIAEDVADGVADTFGDFYTENKINYIPQCMTQPLLNNQSANVRDAQLNYEACKQVVEFHFGCPDEEQVFCPEFSNAFVTLEDELNRSHADQKAAALEKKLGNIVTKMSTMEEHVNYMSNYLTQLNLRFKCYISNCD